MKLLFCDEQRMFVDGIAASLLNELFIERVESVRTIEQSIQIIESNSFDIFIFNIEPSFIDLLEYCTLIKDINPAIKILILSISKDDEIIQKSRALSANGFLQKNASIDELITALKSIKFGVDFYPSEYTSNSNNHFSISSKKLFKKLTLRELEVLDLILESKSNREISVHLFLSVHTVNNHRKNIFKKLKVNNVICLTKLVFSNHQ
jgi:DNA-binding NarL/FixJ family response regulator